MRREKFVERIRGPESDWMAFTTHGYVDVDAWSELVMRLRRALQRDDRQMPAASVMRNLELHHDAGPTSHQDVGSRAG